MLVCFLMGILMLNVLQPKMRATSMASRGYHIISCCLRVVLKRAELMKVLHEDYSVSGLLAFVTVSLAIPQLH